MHSVANATGAIEFVRECTGMELSIHYSAPCCISLNVPPHENMNHLAKVLAGKFGTEPVTQVNVTLGRKTWTWHFTEDRSLVLMHFMQDRGRAHGKNFIRLHDGGQHTAYYGPAN